MLQSSFVQDTFDQINESERKLNVPEILKSYMSGNVEEESVKHYTKKARF